MNLDVKMVNSSISKLIVTIAFFYSALVCHIKAIELFENKDFYLAFFLWFCALTSFCGALRFQIAKIVYKIRDFNKNEEK